jgi:hypothetical protein
MHFEKRFVRPGKLVTGGLVLMVMTARAAALPVFPLAPTLTAVRVAFTNTTIASTGLSRDDYLATIEGIVTFFQHFQNADGRVNDPFVHREVQYSTPTYAWATAVLVDTGRRPDLVESGANALEAALGELAEGKPADRHGDFFTFPAMLAFEHLREHVTPDRRRRWEDLLRALQVERAYSDLIKPDRKTVHNWNVVAIAGEFLRSQDGFANSSFVDRYLGEQLPYFTAAGMYRDPNVPMAYDHFPRHFLAAMLARGYTGAHQAQLGELLERAAWTSLLIQSPAGELPTGGRSAQHQWNEAEQCVTYEIWAARKQRTGDVASARAFKRAAHLSLQSIRRWVRPSGELWIVKNRFDPAVRHGFEGYSFHSQYNLLTASMLATAWRFANDDIVEGPSPADVGGFVVELPEFHKVIANAGGLYAEIETAADPHYNSTGLLRIHRSGIETLIGPSDGTAIQESAVAVGIAWREGDHWQSLAAIGQSHPAIVTVTTQERTPELVRFTIRYGLDRPQVRSVIEHYELTPLRMRVTAELEGRATGIQVRFPAFAFDGERAARIAVDGGAATVELGGSREAFRVESPSGIRLRRAGSLVSSRNGYLEVIAGDVSGQRVTYSLVPEKFR